MKNTLLSLALLCSAIIGNCQLKAAAVEEVGVGEEADQLRAFIRDIDQVKERLGLIAPGVPWARVVTVEEEFQPKPPPKEGTEEASMLYDVLIKHRDILILVLERARDLIAANDTNTFYEEFGYVPKFTGRLEDLSLVDLKYHTFDRIFITEEEKPERATVLEVLSQRRFEFDPQIRDKLLEILDQKIDMLR